MAEHTGTRVATVYAEALYDAAVAAGVADAVRADVESLRQLLGQYPKFAELLADPEIAADERGNVIRRSFDGRVDHRTLNLLLVLSRRYRMGSLAAILAEYARMDDARRLGRREVEVVTAGPLDEGMFDRIRQGVAAWGGFEPVLRVRQDASLLGGLVIRIGDRKIDASVRGQLARLRERLKKEFESRVSQEV